MIEDMGNDSPSSMAMKEQCKPDYEHMIKTANAKLTKNVGLREAVFVYAGNVRLRNKMAELVGELYSEQRQLESKISSLIKEQEKDSED